MSRFQLITADVVLGQKVQIASFVNLYGCKIGDETKIGSFVEIQKNASIGNRCKISSHSFICEGVTIKDNCFIGHGVVFINDNHPRAVNDEGQLECEKDWADRFAATYVKENASIGSNATILGDITIGKNAVVGAGSVVVCDIPAGEIWAGNPARKINSRDYFYE